jgi:hypothetical protein
VYSYPEAAVCAEAVPEFCLPSGVTVRPYTHHSHSTDPLARRLVGPLADMKVGGHSLEGRREGESHFWDMKVDRGWEGGRRTDGRVS